METTRRPQDDDETPETMGEEQAMETAAEYAYRTADEWAEGDPHLAAAQRALLDGSARRLLKQKFAQSGMDAEALGVAVGHPARVARRVVEGKENLNATNVAAYLKAMDAHGKPNPS